MTTRQAAADEKNLYVMGEAGSFSWNRIQGGTSGRGETYDWNIGAIYLQTDNQEPNSAFSQVGVAASAGVDAGEDTSIRFILRGETNEAGAPGQTVYIRPDLDASEEQSRLVVGATLDHSGGSNGHQFRVGLSKTNKLSLNPEDSGAVDLEPAEDEIRLRIRDFSSADGILNNTQRMTLAYKADIPTQRHLITAGGDVENQKGELGSETPESAEIPEDAPPFFRRFQQSGLSYPTRTNLAAYVQDRIIIRDNMLLTAGARLERNGSFGTHVLPRAALSWTVGPATTIKASAGIGLKEPSLEQSYGGNFRVQGNPDLEPERSRTIDAGIVQSFWGDRLFVEATVFHHMYQDQIALGNLEVPTFESVFGDMTMEERRQMREEIRAGLRERPQFEIDFDQFRPSYINIGETRARGAELSFGASPILGTQLRADYTFLDGLAIESSERWLEEGSTLPNRPRHQFVFNGQSEIGPVTFGGTVLYVGERLADVDFVSRALDITHLEAYTRVDIRGHFRISPRFEIFAVSENLLDAEYMEILGYPALGRSIRAGLRLDLEY
jgi:outer membrane receptor protein involved in Fe transport